MKKYEVRQLILDFLSGSPALSKNDWDDFTSCMQELPEIEAIRREILDIDARNPADKKGVWCSEKGIAELQSLIDRLGQELAQEKFIAVICGIKSEAAAVRAALGEDNQARIGVSGANAARAEELAREFCERGASAIISVGVSGGLDPALKPGDLVIGETVIADDGSVYGCDRYLLAAITSAHSGEGRNLGPQVQDKLDRDPGMRRDERDGYKLAKLFGANEIIDSASKKAALFQNHKAVAVDMESHGAARAAALAGVPFIAIRAIADPADRALPPAALGAVGPDGSTLVLKTLGAALRDPKQFPGLMKLGADSAAATNTLRRDLGPLFFRLFLSLDL